MSKCGSVAFGCSLGTDLLIRSNKNTGCSKNQVINRTIRISPTKSVCRISVIKFKMAMAEAKTGHEESNAKLWANLCLEGPSLVSAQFASENGDKVHSVWSQRDLITSRKRQFSTTYIFSREGRYDASPPVEIYESSTSTCHYSPSRERFLKFTSKNEGDGETVAVEVWNAYGGLDIAWEVDRTIHGPVFTDEWFSSVSWSPDEKMVAYIADRGKPKSSKDGTEDQQESWASPLEYKFHENARDPFGEGFINRRSPSLFIADVVGGCSHAATEDPADRKKDLFFGEPQWSPDGKKIVATMRRSPYLEVDDHFEPGEFWPTDLGFRYCYNRRSAIVVFDAPQSVKEVQSGSLVMHVVSSDTDDDDFCCLSPRFSLDSSNIVYISNPRVGSNIGGEKVLPHNMTKVLRTFHMGVEGFSAPRTLISIPDDPAPDCFPGLYLHSLPENPWLDANTVVFTTTWGSVNKILSTKLHREGDHFVASPNRLEMTDWGAQAAKGSENEKGLLATDDNLSLIDVCRDKLLVAASSPAEPTRLLAVCLENGSMNDIQTLPVSVLSARALKLKELVKTRKTFDLVAQGEGLEACARMFDQNSDEAWTRYQVTILLPQQGEQKLPLVVFPHGGPHVTTVNGYSQGAVALLKRGFAVLYVNYRGSLGLGQKSLETLPGRIGIQDIAEVVQATRWALNQCQFSLNANRVGFLGGSHSGFIGAHTSLIPYLFKRTVLRNPVVNIATMVGATDIPDWCFCEASLHRKNANGLVLAPDGLQLQAMYRLSPVSKVEFRRNVLEQPGPTLLQVGGSDRRVPPQQSLEWKRIMSQAYGSESVVIRWYPGSGHGIEEVPNGDDSWVHALDFLCQL